MVTDLAAAAATKQHRRTAIRLRSNCYLGRRLAAAVRWVTPRQPLQILARPHLLMEQMILRNPRPPLVLAQAWTLTKGPQA